MILNISKIKTEALLLFCKDLILSYQNQNDVNENNFDIDKEIIEEFNNISNDMLKQISNVTLPNQYYLQNRKHYRIKSILGAYNFINNEISINLKKNEEFNPSMLYFSLLALWFKELNKESRSKEYIYFILYPYSFVYDKLLVKMQNQDFKKLNIKMIELAEKIIYKFDSYNLK
ncbi:hypothetical protein CP963_06175 [Arcobacter cloacae]|uniref:Uncharacterized protein n=2 Tax=Arcobacter cloacae TaxID=1054034 RepID=A0AA94JXM3_9BACT|nr:hypothetical protein CP963_06175 [Arcobacter cloacae]